MSVKEYEESGFGKLGDAGKRGGTVTLINNLPVGTKFWVDNGNWGGEVVSIEGVKHMCISGGRNVNLESDIETVLDITIDEDSPNYATQPKDTYVKWKHVEELMSLIKARDNYMDWMDEYAKYDKKVKKTVEWLERNAKEWN